MEENLRVFQSSFIVEASAAAVYSFHMQAESLGKITPSLALLRFHSLPSRLGEGSRIDFTMQLGPVPVRWTAQLEDVSLSGFADRQLVGPFDYWRHRHDFIPLSKLGTRIDDRIEARLGRGLRKRSLSQLMWLSLPALFAYRKRQTKQLLKSS